MNNDWKNDPKLAGMDHSKLEMLQGLAEQGLDKNMSNMMPFLMSAASQGKKNGLNFTGSEIQMIMEVLKSGKSPEEAAKLDRIASLMKMIR